ncbi:cobalamin biosynthesis protein [Paraburkholderia jirisanensis]
MKRLVLGIGCRSGASFEQIDAAVRDALGAHSIDEVLTVATLDSKAQEPGLLAFCARHALALQAFSRAQIAGAPAGPTPSETVRAHAGVGGVCEPCALLAAPAGQLITPKRVRDGVTVAIASFDTGAHASHAAHVSNPSIAQDPP